MSKQGRRATCFEQFNANTEHQRMAGCASWAAFSARWRARQGLPLLHPFHVQYLTPQDFRSGLGQPLSPTQQRLLFRQYVEAAMQSYVAVATRVLIRICVLMYNFELAAVARFVVSKLYVRLRIRIRLRETLPLSADLAFVHAQGFQHRVHWQPDFLFGGREDAGRYEPEALLPTRPYGIPTTSRTFEGYWLEGNAFLDEEDML